MNFIYDIETLRAVFSAVIYHAETGNWYVFEASRRRNNTPDLVAMIRYIRSVGGNMIGFNSLHFDYPVIHDIVAAGGTDELTAYMRAQTIIQSNDRFGHTIWPDRHHARQIDLYKMHHFDNRARATSLKDLEFNMRLDNIEEMPHDIHAEYLSDAQIDDVLHYNAFDVAATYRFWLHSRAMIADREKLSAKYNVDWINHSDKKIGQSYFIKRLEELQPGSCYRYVNGRREAIQTARERITVADILLPAAQAVTRPEFATAVDWFRQSVITATKGELKYKGQVGDCEFTLGTGGIHASLKRKHVKADDDWLIVDVDVKSYYPNLSIVNRLGPAHLGELFAVVNSEMFEMRKKTVKTDPDNGMYKLGMNGAYGDSGAEYGPFRDPQYTMAITVNGQCLLLVLADIVLNHTRSHVIQMNTDGITFMVQRPDRAIFDECLKVWEKHTGLELEHVDYSDVWIRDVNSYMARTTAGKLKQIGDYETADPADRQPRGWHQDCSAMVVPRVAECVLTTGADAMDTLVNWPDPFDFMLRLKVGRNSVVVDDTGRRSGRVTRYFVSKLGVQMRKDGGRVCAGWYVTCCNNAAEFDWFNLELRWYAQQVRKLIVDESYRPALRYG